MNRRELFKSLLVGVVGGAAAAVCGRLPEPKEECPPGLKSFEFLKDEPDLYPDVIRIPYVHIPQTWTENHSSVHMVDCKIINDAGWHVNSIAAKKGR